MMEGGHSVVLAGGHRDVRVLLLLLLLLLTLGPMDARVVGKKEGAKAW